MVVESFHWHCVVLALEKSKNVEHITIIIWFDVVVVEEVVDVVVVDIVDRTPLLVGESKLTSIELPSLLKIAVDNIGGNGICSLLNTSIMLLLAI